MLAAKKRQHNRPRRWSATNDKKCPRAGKILPDLTGADRHVSKLHRACFGEALAGATAGGPDGNLSRPTVPVDSCGKRQHGLPLISDATKHSPHRETKASARRVTSLSLMNLDCRAPVWSVKRKLLSATEGQSRLLTRDGPRKSLTSPRLSVATSRGLTATGSSIQTITFARARPELRTHGVCYAVGVDVRWRMADGRSPPLLLQVAQSILKVA